MKVGVTGGIGSGKTSVCRLLNILGIPVFDADFEAKKITDSNDKVIERLSEIAGQNLLVSGELDRGLLASLVFNDADKLQQVNRLIHPMVFNAFDEWCSMQDSPYVIFEAAILFESGADKLVDRVITVIAPLSERIERVIARSGMSVAQVEERIQHQLPQQELIERSHYVVNNADSNMIIPAVLEIHRELLMESEKYHS